MIHDDQRAAQSEPVSLLPDFTCKGCGHAYFGAREPVHCIKCTSVLFDSRVAPQVIRQIEKDARKSLDARTRMQVEGSAELLRAVLPLWICRACDNPSDNPEPLKCQHCRHADFVARPKNAKALAAAMRLIDVSGRLRVVLADLNEPQAKWFKMAMGTQRYLRKAMAAVYVAEGGK